MVFLCLFGLCLMAAVAPRKKKNDDRIYLLHSDELEYDENGDNPEAQIVRGNVQFRQDNMLLWCDSAYFYQQQNAVDAFGHVRFKQGDTLSLTCDRANYEGIDQMMYARENVVLKHRKQTLYTDSLNYDRLYGQAYFFEGGRLVEGRDNLVSDWGRYDTGTRIAVFYYNVRMTSDKSTITGDTLYYDTQTSLAHITGPSTILNQGNEIHTKNAYFDSDADKARLFDRSTVINGAKTITADTLYNNNATAESEGFGNVVFIDNENKNSLVADHVYYNDSTGYGFATRKAVLKDFSQSEDTLYAHADTLKMFSYNLDTDSVYRIVHGYDHVRAFRVDLQAVCDSMVMDSRDSCLTLYYDPIVWSDNRQLLGEEIKMYSNDSTIREAQVIGQALSIEQYDTLKHYNQLSAKRIDAYFTDGKIRRTVAAGNVLNIFYPVDDSDSTLTGLNHLETDTMRMFFTPERKLEYIKTTKATATMFPMTQIPPDKYKLQNFAWFDDIRPANKDDIFVWKPKPDDKKLRPSVAKGPQPRKKPVATQPQAQADTIPNQVATGEIEATKLAEPTENKAETATAQSAKQPENQPQLPDNKTEATEKADEKADDSMPTAAPNKQEQQ